VNSERLRFFPREQENRYSSKIMGSKFRTVNWDEPAEGIVFILTASSIMIHCQPSATDKPQRMVLRFILYKNKNRCDATQ
jgi:hypothetical protein